jgi:maleylacetate reductase
MKIFTHRRSKQERIYFGGPAAQSVAREAQLCDASRVLVLSNPSLERENTLLAGVVDALGERCAGVLAEMRAHSPSGAVHRAVEAARTYHVDLFVAVGGGSVIDSAKVALACYLHGAATIAELKARLPYGPVDPSRVDERALVARARVVAVPTTLSAAEFSWSAGCTDESVGVKLPFAHPLMVPQAAILDPRATLRTPEALFLSTGIRSVDHAAERLASGLSTDFCDATAVQALTLLSDALRRVKADPADLAARLDAQTGTWMSVAGEESGVPVGISHAIGRVLGVHAQMPHGFTSCVLLSAAMRWNAATNAAPQAQVAAALGRPGASAAQAIAELVADLGLPGRLRDVGVTREMFEPVARQVFEGGGARNNPRPIGSFKDIVEIMEIAW